MSIGTLQVKKVMPKSLLEERKVLIDRLNVLEHESTLAQLREDALTEELKQRETERCAAKWACLAHKLLTKQKRYSHFAEVAKLKGRCTNMEQRLTKFADGLRLRSKAGGARALTHEQLDLLSPRTVSPAISDDEGVFTPTNTTPRRRLARRFRPAADIQVAPSVLVQLPGKLGEMEVNRANTLRETGKAMQQAVENGIRHISYAAVVQRPKTTPVQDACSGGISSPTPRAKTGPQWKSFQPSMLGDDVDAFNDERQWAALFDGAGTDPGCFGANSLAHGSNAEPEDPQFDEIDRQEVSSVMPFIGVPPPGSRGGARKSRGARHRPVLATAEQLAGENGRMDGGSCQDAEAMAGEDLPSATSEVLDSARDMPSEAARLKQPGAAPPTAPPLQRHPVPSLNLTGINSCARGTEDSPLLDEDEADGARPDLDDASKQPLPDTDRAFQGPYRMRHDNAWDDPFGSQFDRDLVPRSALLELKLRHSLKIRSMQRAFEERLQIVNSYWHDQGMYMLDRKHATSQGTSTSARSSGVHSMPGSRTGARPEATIMNFSHYKGPYRDGRPERLSTPGSEVSGQPWWDSTTWPRDDGSVPHYRSPTRQTSPLRHQKHVQGDSIRHGLLNSQGRPVPAHVLEAARPSSKDGSSWLEVNTLEPKYHAFIYPSQRAISTRQEDKEELTKHNLRTHVKTHVVKPYHKRKAAASTDGKHPAAAQNRPGSKVSAREAAT